MELAPDGQKKGSRVFVSGSFDIFNYAHAEYLHLAKKYGKRVIVGVQNDIEVESYRATPIFDECSRLDVISHVKWVDETIEDAPEEVSVSLLNQMDVDFCIPGEGTQNYKEVENSGRFRTVVNEIQRTNYEIIGKLYAAPKHVKNVDLDQKKREIESMAMDGHMKKPWTKVMVLSEDQPPRELAIGRNPRNTDKIVYICGDFDFISASTIEFFKAAKENHDFLILGLFDDQTIFSKTRHYSINNLYQRLASLLAFNIIDEILINAPVSITSDFVRMFNIKTILLADFNNSFIEVSNDYDQFLRTGRIKFIEIEEYPTANWLKMELSKLKPF